MATYNAANHLGTQLQSILEQTVPPAEIIVSDDASEDATQAIVTEFAARSPFPIRLTVNRVRLGWQRNFIQAAQQCSGDIIAFSDHDDFWLPGKIESILQSARETIWLALVHANAFMNTRNITIPKPRMLNGASFTRSASFYGEFDGHRMAFRRELLPWLAFHEEFDDWLFDAKIAHDRLIMLAALTVGQAIFLDEPLTLFRRHSGQVTTSGERASNAEDYWRRSEVLSNWINALEKIQANGLVNAADANAMSSVLQRLARAFEGRAELHGRRSLAEKIEKFSGLVRHSAYDRKVNGGLGLKSLAKDAVSLVRPSR